ncbi:MAG: hypothetical protein ACRYFZ_10905 [Janthinobacterium lividum]
MDAIEVFKTNIASEQQGTAILAALRQHFPALHASLDLDDCDRVLRVQHLPTNPVCWAQVQAFIHHLGVAIEPLPD